MSETLLSCQGLTKIYGELTILSGINIEVPTGSLVAIMGVSGSGKSTLLHCLGGLDAPSEGNVMFMGENLTHAKPAIKNQWRQFHMGFIYQFHYLMAEITALENVALALRIAGIPINVANQQAKLALTEVGLEERLYHRPSELSGGERQRVAVARAFVHRPKLIMADEPTGSLDRDNAIKVWGLLREQCHQQGASLVVVTHDATLAKTCDFQYQLEQGQLRPHH